jgi:hypothetical protein|tara:strand:+ start:21021 stop:21233 length:213 start_codon:yes stop_codon:yes gene_type:complete
MTNKKSMKLFVLRYGKGGDVVKGEDGTPLYFNDKQVAKNHRGDNMVVSYGPDHRKHKGGIDASHSTKTNN